MQDKFYVRKVAVLGAGVMGAQIAAHFGNASIPVVLFDLKSTNGPVNEILDKSIINLKKLNPKPLASIHTLDYITIANYDDNLELLKGCDFVIEAIAERLDWKEGLYKKILPYLNSNTIIASNTSGLSIEKLSRSFPEDFRHNFCGIHFFNPPRYMSLVELIPHSGTDKNILPLLETFLVTELGKSVIVAKDTPNFIANRIGVFSMLATCINAEKYNIPFEVVDKLTGKDLGRAKSATFRTADIVGLDTFAKVVKTMEDNCQDGWAKYYKTPAFIEKLISQSKLGAKTKAGIFIKDQDGIKVIDPATGEYRLADKKADKSILDILRGKDWETKFDALYKSPLPEAQFLWASFRDSFHYAATLLGDICDTPREIDLALRWGFGFKEGLFEIWQQAGWDKIAKLIKDEIDNGKTLSNTPLPSWVFEQKNGVYLENKHFNIIQNKLVERKLLPVYERQLFPDLLLNETSNITMNILYENDGVKLWHTGDNIGILSFKSKMCTIGKDVLEGIENAIKVAEEKCQAMVIWQEQDIFSAGANLEEFGFDIMMNGEKAVWKIIEKGHQVITQQLRYSKIPVVSAVKGYAFGGGCEIILHSDGVVAALESYIGLVEAGVGILPGWGGTKEMAYRASQSMAPWQDFEKRYKNLAMGKVATSAKEAQEMGFFRDSDIIMMNVKEILFVAKERAKFMAISGYRPPIKKKFVVFGEQGIAIVKGLLENMYAGGQISEHDRLIGHSIAEVMCGGEIESESQVSEDWILKLEKEKFCELATSQKSAERMQHMLETGKPLRN